MEEATELMLMMDPPSGIFATRAFTIQNMLLTLMSMLLCKVENVTLLNIDKVVINWQETSLQIGHQNVT